MQILQVCTKFGVGGIARHAIDLGQWLRQQGHSIYFAGTSGENMDNNRDDKFIPLGIDRVSGDSNTLVRVGYALACGLQLRKFLNTNKVDLIHCHESAAAIVARLSSMGMNIPILLTYHGSEPERIRGFARIGKITAQQVITPSYRSAADLIGQGGLDKSKVRVIGLGVKSPPPVDHAVIAQLRKELLGKDGKLLIVVVARITYQKGIDILIKVVERMNQYRRDIRIVVVGDGVLWDEMRALSKSTGVDHLVRFVGYSKEPCAYLHASDLFLLTSRWEALPISIVEAFRAGLPVIAADTSGVEELVDSSVGDVLPIGDIEGFAQSTLRILDDDNLRKNMANNALSRSKEERFSPDYIHHIYEKNYAETLGISLEKRV